MNQKLARGLTLTAAAVKRISQPSHHHHGELERRPNRHTFETIQLIIYFEQAQSTHLVM